jgi:hypothetical protein
MRRGWTLKFGIRAFSGNRMNLMGLSGEKHFC